MICIPITSATQAKAIQAIERSAPAADAIELRMDLITAGNLPELMAAARRTSERVKIIVTCRRPEEALMPEAGGTATTKTDMTQTVKMNLLQQAVALGADFVDIELACGEKAIKQLQAFGRKQKSSTQIIVSWHDIDKTPSLTKLESIFQACAQTGADIVKIVPYARNREDNLKVLNLLAHVRKRRIV